MASFRSTGPSSSGSLCHGADDPPHRLVRRRIEHARNRNFSDPICVRLTSPERSWFDDRLRGADDAPPPPASGPSLPVRGDIDLRSEEVGEMTLVVADSCRSERRGSAIVSIVSPPSKRQLARQEKRSYFPAMKKQMRSWADSANEERAAGDVQGNGNVISLEP